MTPTVESEVTVRVGNSTQLTLTGTRPVESAASADSLNITGRLVGSFAWTRPPTDWGLSFYAAAPNIAASATSISRDWNPRNPFKSGLLIPQTDVDLSGRTCNKIGVSHSAFVNNQGSRCSAKIGDCLANQIEDLLAVASPIDLLPARLCQSIGGKFVENDGYRLSCILTDAASDVPTQVLLELNADQVQIVYNESLGYIANVSVASTVEGLVQRTDVRVQVSNTGELTSEFMVSVSGCEPPDRLTYPFNAVRASIVNGGSAVVTLKVEDAEVDGTVYACNLTLSDSEGATLDIATFTLNITSVEFDKGVQGGVSDGTAEDGNAGLSGQSNDACSTQCTTFIDILCFAKNLCWSRLGSLMGVVGGSGLALFLATKLGLLSMLWKGMKACCKCSGGDNRKRRNSEVTSDEPEQYPYNTSPPPYNPYFSHPYPGIRRY